MKKRGAAESQPPDLPVADNARELMAELRALATRVPGLRLYPAEPDTWPRGYRTVTIEFIEAVADLIRLSPTLRQLDMINESALRQRVDYIRALRPFRDDVEGLLRSLDYTLERVHADAAAEALRAYTVAQSIRPAASSNISDVTLARARQTLGRHGKKRKKKPEGE